MPCAACSVEYQPWLPTEPAIERFAPVAAVAFAVALPPCEREPLVHPVVIAEAKTTKTKMRLLQRVFLYRGPPYTRYLLGGLSIYKHVGDLEDKEIDRARLDRGRLRVALARATYLSCCLGFAPRITAHCDGRAAVGGIDQKRDALIAALGGNRSTRRSRSMSKERPVRVGEEL